MGRKPSAEEIARYKRDGFLLPVAAFSGEEAARWRAALEDFEAKSGQAFRKGHNFKLPSASRSSFSAARRKAPATTASATASVAASRAAAGACHSDAPSSDLLYG